MLTILYIDSDLLSTDRVQNIFRLNPLFSELVFVKDTDQALFKLLKINPDIIFIEYPFASNSGVEFVKLIQTKFPEVVLVLVSESKLNAASAIRLGVYNFILKPLVLDDINACVEKGKLQKENFNKGNIVRIIEDSIEISKVKFQTIKGSILLNTQDIIFCKADGVYTLLYLTNNRIETSIQFISQVLEIIEPYNFLRVSRSCLINLRYLRKVYRDNCSIILSVNGQEYEVKGTKSVVKNIYNFEVEA